ncbi:MAG TPA: MDR family oxidoreductase [Nitrospiraceae bacterium]|nr:MDR family oxidoreductase [Nitrospiraceae bacterium]
MKETFKALVLEQKDGDVHYFFRILPMSALPDGEVLVSVTYSSLNYKDALAVTGQGKIISRYPMVPGIDLAGTVEESASAEFKPGDQVLLTGWGIGERHWGGYAQAARVKAEWLLHLPQGLSLKEVMGIGTAGLTAMLSVMELETRGLKPGGREMVVTGAAGGVGGMAVAILANLGYRVVASTGRSETRDYLKQLGASEIIDRQTLSRSAEKALESERWAGAVDTVGGATLATLLRTLAHGAAVAACGLASGSDLSTTVFPFILRGVGLIGIASSTSPQERRREAWTRLAHDLPREALDRMIRVAPLADVPSLSREILHGKIRGRVVIDPNQ